MSNTSMPAKRLNSHPLSFHHRLEASGAEVTQAENRGAVGNHCHQVALAGVLVGQLGIAGDFLRTGSATPGCRPGTGPGR